MRRILPAFAVLALIGCGGGGGGGGDGFSIKSSMTDTIYVYSTEEGEMGITYDASLGQVLGVVARTPPINFAGPLDGKNSWEVTLHIADADNNGTISDDVPFDAVGSGEISNGGNHAEVHYQLDILGISVPWDWSGDLVRTVPKT